MISRIISFDTETALIRPGVCAPEMACLTWQLLDPRTGSVSRSEIVHVKDAERILHAWLTATDVIFVGANTAFDFGVVCANFPHLTDLVWKAYEQDRVTDVQIREQLLDIAKGTFQGYHTPDGGWIKPKYNLADVSKKYGMYLDKPKSLVSPSGKMWDDPMHPRLRFQELIPYPVSEWDSRVADLGFTGPPPTMYAKEDAEATLLAWMAQEKHRDYLKLQYEFCRRAWALHLASAWGTRTDAQRVVELIAEAELVRGNIRDFLVEHGLVREDGSRDTKNAQALMLKVCAEKGLKVPVTPTGQPQLGEDACDATEDPLLETYADYGRLGSTISKDGVMLARGTVYPIHTRYNMAATGRTTSSNPNMQNLGRDVGPRECFVPRAGKIIAQADYEAIELRTLAQVCIKLFGRSRLAEALNSGKDPHLQMGADMLGITYEEAKARRKLKDHVVEDARQAGKVANFGFPGGLGPEKLCLWAKKSYGVVFSMDRAKELKAQWLASWPEMALYFEYVNRLCSNATGMADIEVPISGFRRGGATYCAACNTGFQSLAATAAGRGVWYVQRANYHDRSSVLFGSRAINFVHDEMLVEVSDDPLAHDRALELERLMVKGANEYLPDVPASAPPMLMRYWSKEAFALKGQDGRLLPWNGEKP